MKYSFKDILTQEIYDNTRVMLVLGKYNVFTNLVIDTLKDMSVDKHIPNMSLMGLSEEFGLDEDDDSDEKISTAVDFDTFLEVVNVSNINGKWFCNLDLDTASKKQRENLLKYIKSPSRYGILVIKSKDYKVYKDLLKHKYFLNGQYSHIMQLGFPNKQILNNIVKSMFEQKELYPDAKSIELFITRINTEYDKYLDIINKIEQTHKKGTVISVEEMKSYLVGIEYFDIEDFMYEVIKPISSSKMNNKKIIRMLSSLKEKYEVSDLVNQLIVKINEMIDFRLIINRGYITVNMRYLFSDVIKLIGEDNKYAKMNEFVFRRKADLAAQTSLNDWVYMKLILTKASLIGFDGSVERTIACEKAIYDLAMRSVMTESRLNNILGIENILYGSIKSLDRVEFNEEALKTGVRLGKENALSEQAKIDKEMMNINDRIQSEKRKELARVKRIEKQREKNKEESKNDNTVERYNNSKEIENSYMIYNMLNGGIKNDS